MLTAPALAEGVDHLAQEAGGIYQTSSSPSTMKKACSANQSKNIHVNIRNPIPKGYA